MYDLYAVSTGDAASVVSAIAAVGVLLGMLLGWILNYVLRIEKAITDIERRTLAIEDAVKEIKAWKATL